MEFDTSLKLRPSGTVSLRSDKDMEEFCRDVWTVLDGEAKAVGDSGAGEFWTDWSTPLQTRHIVVNVEPCEGGYNVKFRAGKRPGRIADVLLMGLALLLMWCLSKSVVPSPPAIYVAGAVISAVAAVVVLILCYGKTFGKEETAHLTEKMHALK